MADIRPTYQISAPSIRPYVKPLWPGCLAMPIDTRDEEGRRLRLADDNLSGQYLVLAFLGDAHGNGAVRLLEELAELESRFDACAATVVVISASSDAAHNKKLKWAASFPWPIGCDASGGIFASYGLHKEEDRTARLVLLTPYRQVRAWFDTSSGGNSALGKIMDILETDKASDALRWAPPHAPILTVPHVLSPEECGKLIEAVETDSPFLVRRPQPGEVVSNYKVPVYDHHRQDRVDLVIRNRDTLALLDERIFERVTPMIKKAFAFDVKRREDLHIARYVGKREGFAIGHRDNVEPAVAHRRFALSISLNDDYDGGEIVFREFSPRGYRVPAGTAMVFSSSLLHEVEETTSGVRYNLISHFFG